MNILMLSSEVAPYAKTGGLGEVMGALPKAIHRLGHDVRVYMPLFGTINRQQFAFVPIGKPQQFNIAGEKSRINFSASILSQEVPIYFFGSDHYFPVGNPMYSGEAGNLPFFAYTWSVFKLLDTLDWIPDVIHIHDWHAAPIAGIIKRLPEDSPYKKITTVQTIHNASFVAITDQTSIPKNRVDKTGRPLPHRRDLVQYINFLRRGIADADMITTVSERHAAELLDPETGHGLTDLLENRRRCFYGIRNGVDYSFWNPMFDSNLPVNYDSDILHRKYDNKRALQHRMKLPVNEDVPILGMNTRITEQKGFSLVFEIFDELMAAGVQIVVVGTGMGSYVKFLTQKMKQYPKQVAFRPYSEKLGSLVYAGADIFLMPSLFEPSGLGQLVSLRYGTIPVVRRTGGLADTIFDYNSSNGTGNGFVFDDYTGPALREAIDQALELWKDRERWQRLMEHGMNMSYSWEIPAKKYERIYKAAMKEHRGQPWSLPKKW